MKALFSSAVLGKHSRAEREMEKDKEKNIEKDKEKNIEKDKEENTEKDQQKKIIIFHHSLGRVQWGMREITAHN